MSANRYKIVLQDDGAFVVTNLNGHRFIVDANCCDIRSRAIRQLLADKAELAAVLLELAECSQYWSEYDVPLGIHDRIKAALAKAGVE